MKIHNEIPTTSNVHFDEQTRQNLLYQQILQNGISATCSQIYSFVTNTFVLSPIINIPDDQRTAVSVSIRACRVIVRFQIGKSQSSEMRWAK